MPALDRRITINITGPDRRNIFGEFVPGVVTPLGVWCTRIDKTNEDKEQSGGVLSLISRDYIVRYDPRIAAARAVDLSVQDGPDLLNVSNSTEAQGERTERRKFIRIEAVGEVV